jgi:hypothetical protein
VAVEIILLFIAGITLTGFSNPLMTLIVDINPGVTGAASAANNLTKGLVGAAASAFINPLITAVGTGFAFTIIALSYVIFFPALWLVMRDGVKWRQEKLAKKGERANKREKQQETESAGQLELQKAPEAIVFEKAADKDADAVA